MTVMGRPDNGSIADVVIERRGLRITRLTVDGMDLTRHCRRIDVVLDVNDGPVVKLELYGRATIQDIERDPVADLVEDQVEAWPELEDAPA